MGIMAIMEVVVAADSEDKLRKLVYEFGRVCERRKLTVNVSKSKVMRCSGATNAPGMYIPLNGVMLEEVDRFNYLGACVTSRSGCEDEITSRIGRGFQAWGMLNSVVKCRSLGVGAKRRLYEGVVVPTVLYGAETWNMRVEERRKLNVLEMKCLRSMIGVTRRDRVRNEEVRRRTGVVKTLDQKVEQRVLRWFGHMERMNEERLVKQVFLSSVEGRSLRGRPRMGWLDGVKIAVGERGLSLEQARTSALDRSAWTVIVND